ncbi:MAG: efflux RND transporter periplasmic adaptor subunit [Nitrospira sp. SB0662_bin_26]|nr:efflux RND transporter periplasmic adaptor subunit [Nitrospira sp. SB0662_bin_26]
MSPGIKGRRDHSSASASAKDFPDLDDLIIEKNPPRKSRRFAKSVAFIVGVALVFLSINTYLSSDPLSRPPRVQVTRVQRLLTATAQGALTATGYVVAQRQASVASKGTGRLTSVQIDVGDRVTKGQVLATIEQADVKAKLLQAEARLDVAEAALANAQPESREATLHYRRTKALADEGLVTLEELDVAEARLRRSRAAVRSTRSAVNLAQAEIQAVQIEVANTMIRAPFDGTVIEKFAEVGEMVAPMAGASNSRGSVAAIADLRTLQVEAEVSESFLSSVGLEQPAHISLEAVPGHVYHGSVSQIVPTADRTKAAIPVKIRIDDLDEKVFPDMSATVTFLEEPSPSSAKEVPPDTLGVSPDAIVTRNGQTMVLLVVNNVVSEMPVEIGSPLNGLIPVRGEVIEGDTVVANPPEALVEGSIIQEHFQE